MKEIALHILDIAQNSISAGASLVEIGVDVIPSDDELIVSVSDNGKGMCKDQVERVADPYFTSRTTRRVGLGIPLIIHSARQAGGRFELNSEPGKGTSLTVSYALSHIDRQPLGDIPGVVSMLAGANPEIDFIFRYRYQDSEYIFDTRQVKEVLEEIPLSDPSVTGYMKEMISANMGGYAD